MTVEHSRNAVVQIGQGNSPLTFVNIGTQTDFNLSLAAGSIDISNKTTVGWAQQIGDLRSFNARCGFVVDWPDTNGFARARDEAVAGNDVPIRAILNSLGDNYIATTQVTDFEIAAANRDATRGNMTFVLSQGVPAFSSTLT
jgi:hypothetical protein